MAELGSGLGLVSENLDNPHPVRDSGSAHSQGWLYWEETLCVLLPI